mmetsp:Transcript_88391/g.169371  ORF Transcript_88391/g.169371 Transcript_88391/m.169371 type:complete len:96 (+) Transcript_88391:841-1128(+)
MLGPACQHNHTDNESGPPDTGRGEDHQLAPVGNSAVQHERSLRMSVVSTNAHPFSKSLTCRCRTANTCGAACVASEYLRNTPLEQIVRCTRKELL